MKDLTDTEISAYLDIIHDKPFSIPHNDTTSSETENSTSNSIAEMMINYVGSLETSFPSIVATTGRTSDKLELPTINDDPPCLICSMPKQPDNVKTWLDNITVTQAAPDAENGNMILEEEEICDQKDVTGDICYGCYILFRSSRGVVEWPV